MTNLKRQLDLIPCVTYFIYNFINFGLVARIKECLSFVLRKVTDIMLH